MSEYDNTNKGVLFINSYKESGTNQPDMKGKINIDGVEAKLAGWVRDKDDGTKYFSLIVERKEEERKDSNLDPIGEVMGNTPSAPAVELPSSDVGKDDVPF
jgi:hypothetical protein